MSLEKTLKEARETITLVKNFPTEKWAEEVFEKLSKSPWAKESNIIKQKISVEWSKKMTVCAGKAYYGKCAVRLSRSIFVNEKVPMDERVEQCKETLGHEIAHLVAKKVNPKSRPHGPLWKNIMRWIGLPAKRCHSMPTPKRPKRVLSSCARCDKEISLGPIQAKRAKKGQKYVCGRCGRK